MKFSIVESVRKHTAWESAQKVIAWPFLLLVFLCLIPVALILFLFSIFKRKEAKHIPVWEEFYSDKNLRLERLTVDENQFPDNLEFPTVPHDIDLCRIRSIPDLKELRAGYFDNQIVTRDEGVYLLSYNKKGMSIWYIDTVSPGLEKVKDLESGMWSLLKKMEEL